MPLREVDLKPTSKTGWSEVQQSQIDGYLRKLNQTSQKLRGLNSENEFEFYPNKVTIVHQLHNAAER